MIALLGKCDQPTDALRDYCGHLAAALSRRDISLQIVEFDWASEGWPHAFLRVRRQARDWRGQWVAVHYTALAWSRHGFPWRFERVLRTLHRAGVCIAVVFHDSIPPSANPLRFRDRLRRRSQLRAMRRAYAIADRAILSLPLQHITWLSRHADKAVFVPIGSNILPPLSQPPQQSEARPARAVAVFGITGSGRTSHEVRAIAAAMLAARVRIGPVSLVVMGRGAEAARSSLEAALAGSGVTLDLSGILPAPDIARKLAACDVMLFVRGELSPQRGSALAAIACGLPIVGYRGPNTCFPLTEAGLALADSGDSAGLAASLCRILGDGAYRQALRERSQHAYAQYFSWDQIAAYYIEALNP